MFRITNRTGRRICFATLCTTVLYTMLSGRFEHALLESLLFSLLAPVLVGTLLVILTKPQTPLKSQNRGHREETR